jgi:hypothetical protein
MCGLISLAVLFANTLLNKQSSNMITVNTQIYVRTYVCEPIFGVQIIICSNEMCPPFWMYKQVKMCIIGVGLDQKTLTYYFLFRRYPVSCWFDYKKSKFAFFQRYTGIAARCHHYVQSHVRMVCQFGLFGFESKNQKWVPAVFSCLGSAQFERCQCQKYGNFGKNIAKNGKNGKNGRFFRVWDRPNSNGANAKKYCPQ